MSSLRTKQIHSSLNNCYDDFKFIQNNVKAFVKHTTDRLPVLTHITCLQSNLQNQWNSLPSYVVCASTVNSFKSKLDTY